MWRGGGGGRVLCVCVSGGVVGGHNLQITG